MLLAFPFSIQLLHMASRARSTRYGDPSSYYLQAPTSQSGRREWLDSGQVWEFGQTKLSVIETRNFRLSRWACWWRRKMRAALHRYIYAWNIKWAWNNSSYLHRSSRWYSYWTLGKTRIKGKTQSLITSSLEMIRDGYDDRFATAMQGLHVVSLSPTIDPMVLETWWEGEVAQPCWSTEKCLSSQRFHCCTPWAHLFKSSSFTSGASWRRPG